MGIAGVGHFGIARRKLLIFKLGLYKKGKRLITEGYQRLSVTNLKLNAHWHHGITWTSFQFQVDNREFSMLAGAT